MSESFNNSKWKKLKPHGGSDDEGVCETKLFYPWLKIFIYYLFPTFYFLLCLIDFNRCLLICFLSLIIFFILIQTSNHIPIYKIGQTSHFYDEMYIKAIDILCKENADPTAHILKYLESNGLNHQILERMASKIRSGRLYLSDSFEG